MPHGQTGIHTLDWVVVMVYLVGVTILGGWMAHSVKSVADFFMPRRFGKGMMMFSAFGAGTHSDQAVGVSSKTFANGLSGIWIELQWLFCTPFYWLIAPMMRRFRATTTADVFELRYSRGVAMLFAVTGALQMSVNMGTMLKGSSKLIEGASAGTANTHLLIPLMTIMFIIYGVAGGLSAAIVTDYVQGILTVVFSFMLLPFVMHAVGGFEGLRTQITDPVQWQMVTKGEISVFFVLVVSLNSLIGIVTQPHIMGVCAAGKTELDGQWGFMGGNIIKRFCTVAWCLTGFAGIAYFAGRAVDPDTAFGLIAQEFLPRAGHGLLGLFIAALLAAVMSSCSAFMIASGGLLTENIYRPLRPGRSKEHYLLVGRVASVLVVLIGMAIAYRLENVVAGLKMFWKAAAMMGLAFWFGLYWRRTTSAGAWAGTIVAGVLMIVLERPDVGRWAESLNLPAWLGFVFYKGDAPQIYLPWQMIIYLAAGSIATIGASLLTPRAAQDKLDRYYALIRTPVAPGEVYEEPCILPEGAATPPEHSLKPDSDFLIPLPTRQSVTGFTIGWLAVLGVIAMVYLISRAG